MNVTEMHEEVLRLAKSSPDCCTVEARRALIPFAKRVKVMRRKLDDGRRRRAFDRLQRDSVQTLLLEIMKIAVCGRCEWQYSQAKHGWNPLIKCTGDFGCALECLRYRSCEWRPGLLPPVQSDQTQKPE